MVFDEIVIGMCVVYFVAMRTATAAARKNKDEARLHQHFLCTSDYECAVNGESIAFRLYLVH